MKNSIKRIDGRWFINGKKYHEVFGEEKAFFDNFITMMEQEQAITGQKCKEAQDMASKKIIKELDNI